MEKRKIIMSASSGELIGPCAVEAAITALENNVPVEFTHNGRRYKASPFDLLQTVVEIEEEN